jgi:very-short-patch-repair endonuclease
MVYKKRTKERTMFYEAKAATFNFAAQLRESMTEAELLLWDKLKQNKFHGFRFKSQHPIKTFIADFYCHKAKLVIEIDGGIHNKRENKEYDLNRSYEFEQLGLQVIRFTNTEVLKNIDLVLYQIIIHLPVEL